MQVMFIVLMFIVGACVGSFLCCETRRIHYRETKHKKLGARSVCLYCGYQLKWYDNIPIVSWFFLRGKCRKCHTRIGYFEIFAEIATATVVALIAGTIDITNTELLDWFVFGSLFLLISALMFLAFCDGMYGILPMPALIIAGIFAIVYVVLKYLQSESNIIEILISAGILGGLYLVLYLASKGKWVGDGDWILAGIIGLTLGQPFLALLALFISNFSACIVMWPYIHKSKNHKVYFGPFLVFGFVVTFLASEYGIISI